MNSKLRFDLRRFEGEGEPEMVEIKNPTDGTMISIPKDTKIIIDTMVAYARKDTKSKFDEKLKIANDALANSKTDSAEARQALDALELDGKDESEKLKITYQREKKILEDKIEALTSDNDNWKNKYHSNRIKTDIYSSFGNHDLSNIEQTAVLFQAECKAELQDKIDADGNKTGDYHTVMSMTVPDGNGGFDNVTGAPQELFDKWIAKDTNKHLLKSSLIPGGGSNPGDGGNNLTELQQAQKGYDDAMKDKDITLAMSFQNKIEKLKAAG